MISRKLLFLKAKKCSILCSQVTIIFKVIQFFNFFSMSNLKWKSVYSVVRLNARDVLLAGSEVFSVENSCRLGHGWCTRMRLCDAVLWWRARTAAVDGVPLEERLSLTRGPRWNSASSGRCSCLPRAACIV